LQIAVLDGVQFENNPETGTWVASGWRPPPVNDLTTNAAAHSRHMIGGACDIYDPHGELAMWLRHNMPHAEDIGLWFEDFRCTPTWVHGQTVPPKSNNRVYIPSLAWAQKLGLA
jgi:hypothetical protein